MEENKKVNNETEQVANEAPVEVVEKKKFFTKEKLKKIGIFAAGAVAATLATIGCLAVAGARQEELDQDDDFELDEPKRLESASDTEDSSESTEEA